MTFDNNSTRQHFKGVLVSLVTPNEADWYVYCLRHIYTHKKVAHRNLPTGNLHGFVVQSEDLLAARWNIPLSDDYRCKHCVSQRLPRCLANGVPLPLSIAKIRTIFHSAMGCLHYLTKNFHFRFILPPEPPSRMNIINKIIQIMLQTHLLSH